MLKRSKYLVALAFFHILRIWWQQNRYGPKRLFSLSGAHVAFLEPRPEDSELSDTLSSGHIGSRDLLLSELFLAWLKDQGAEVHRVSDLNQMAEGMPEPDVLAVSYEWFSIQTGYRSGGYLRSVYQLRRFLSKSSIRPLVVAPDTYLWSLNLGYGWIATVNDGRVLVIQNTPHEAWKLGVPNACQGQYWTWPRRRLDLWFPSIPWKARCRAIVIPHTGERRRLDLASVVGEAFRDSGWRVEMSGGRDYFDYVDLLKTSRVLMTTSFIPVGGISRSLSRWAPDGTITGRVWEGFASGCVVITNSTGGLRSLGFRDGVHFFDLDRFLANPINFFSLEESELAGMAICGQELFATQVN